MAGAINEKFLLYVDDTAILVSDKHVDAIEARLGTALENSSEQDLELPLKIAVFDLLIINCLYTLVKLSLFCLRQNKNSQTVEI